jgi:hypothetical protein
LQRFRGGLSQQVFFSFFFFAIWGHLGPFGAIWGHLGPLAGYYGLFGAIGGLLLAISDHWRAIIGN